MLELPESLQQLIQEHNLYLEEMDPLKGIWADCAPWAEEIEGHYYNAHIRLGKDLTGKALYLVLLHEVAHYLFEARGCRTFNTRLHGKEWQAIYRELVQEHLDLFPEELNVLDMFTGYTAAKENELLEKLQ